MNQKIIRVGAYGLIIRNDNILLCRLSEKIQKHKGKWTLPGGGLNFGEPPADAMIREVKEETGLECKPSSIAGIDSIFFEKHGVLYHNLRIIYKIEQIRGNLTDELNGTTDKCEWVSLNRINEYPLVDLVVAGLKFI